MVSFKSLALLSLLTSSRAASRARTPSSRCVGVIASLDDVDDAVKCTTININAFTVPDGKTFKLDLLTDTTVNVLGDIQFGNTSSIFAFLDGPLLEVTGDGITFNGNEHLWDGGGPFYWGTKHHKPSPMMKLEISGVVSGIHVINAPAQAFDINSKEGPLVISGINVDNSQGNNVAKNTVAFGVSGNDITVQDNTVITQDDCVAIQSGKNFLVKDNQCTGGNGISIGSKADDTYVANVVIQGNTVNDGQQAFAVGTKQNTLSDGVTNVTFSGNTATNCLSYGLLITQSWPDAFSVPGYNGRISDININQSPTEIKVASGGVMVGINCLECTGNWDWSGLKVSDGIGKDAVNGQLPSITGFQITL